VSITKVSSSHGHLIIDSDSGHVIECNSSKKKLDYLSTIIRVDINRFKLSNKTLDLPIDIDILRLAYWTVNGEYNLPAEHYEIVSMDPDFFNKLIDMAF
jgi:hypothetical protein